MQLAVKILHRILFCLEQGSNFHSLEQFLYPSPAGLFQNFAQVPSAVGGRIIFVDSVLQRKSALCIPKIPHQLLHMLLQTELLFLTPEKTTLLHARGNFERNLLVLALEEPNAVENRDFLRKVLSAANLNLEQDALLAEIPVGEARALAPDLQEFKPKQILVFGLSPSQLGLSIAVQAYQPLNFYGYTWLFADKLSTLEPDKTKKTQLWTALKQIFL